MRTPIPINAEDLAIGMILEWDIYDSSGLKIMEAGNMIGSEKIINSILKRGAFHYQKSQPKEAKVKLQTGNSPFYKISQLADQLNNLFKSLLRYDNEAQQQLRRLAGDLRELRRRHPNALIGAVHLYHDIDYILSHPIHCAILCDLMSNALGQSNDFTLSTMCAALTANISILSLQQTLHIQSSTMSKKQHVAMQQHPQASMAVLKRTGVSDKTWLTAVEQHHWHIDGSGYPYFGSQQPSLAAQLVALTDKYSAMVVKRAYRSAVMAQESLREVFYERGKQFDEQLCLLLIKLMGVYPPGSIVKLNNGEVAVVVKRPEGRERWPTSAAILGSHGNPYAYAKLRNGNDPQFAINSSVALDRYLQLDLHDIWRAS